MSGSMYEFVGHVRRPMDGSDASLFTSHNGQGGFFVREAQSGELVLPVPDGDFSVSARNAQTSNGGFPMRLGAHNARISVYTECRVINLAGVSADYMIELRPREIFKFEGLRAQGHVVVPFIATSGGFHYNGTRYDWLEVGYRRPPRPLPSGATTKSGDAAEDGGYEKRAYSFGKIRLVSREALAAELLANGEVELDPTNHEHWWASHIKDNCRGSRFTDITLPSIEA